MSASPVQYSPARSDGGFFGNGVNGTQNRNHNGVSSPKPYSNNNSSPNQQQKLSGDGQQQPSVPYKEEWFSLEGYLFMKCQSGALNFLQSRKRLYFGLEEFENKLIYYRDKIEFNRKRECLGTIPLHNAVCSLVEGNLCAFVLHTAGKKYVMEADNARCANCWLNALQQRRDLSDALSAAELPTLVDAALRRRRSRSRSRSTACSSRSPVRRPMTAAVDGITAPFEPDIGNHGMVNSMSSGHLLPTPAHQSPYRQRVGRCDTIDVAEDQPAAAPPVRKSSARTAGPGDATSSAWLSGWIGGWLGDQQQQQNGQLEQQNRQPNDQRQQEQQHKRGDQQEKNEEQQQRKKEEQQNSVPSVKSAEAETNVPPEDEHLSHSDSNSESATQFNFTYVEPATEGAAATARRRASRPMLRRISIQELAHNLLMPGKPVKSTSALRDSPSQTSSCPSSPGGGASVTATSPSAGGGASPNPAHFFDELSMLRIVDNRQKERIHELNAECTALVRQLEQLRTQQQQQQQHEQQRPQPQATIGVADSAASLAIATQNRFLNAELLRVNNRCIESEKKIKQCNARIESLESEIEEFKRQYVFLLQSCIRVPLHEHSSCDVVQVKLFGGDIHKYRVCMLLNKAREADPTLPTFESLTTNGSHHVDDYGFRHNFENVSLALHYISTQLHEHYESMSDDYVALKCKWKDILDASPNFIERTRENRHLCRLGIPRVWRSRVWRLLIHQQVASLKEQYGEYYYRNLCSSQGTPSEKHYCSTHQKQINLDLLRTMPGNIHFMSASCKGVTHLQAVLRAFCLHNPTTGYCQGMNFLAATALLFVCPEDAFWFLVAVSERYFHHSYFDQSLSGAQADQEVLKEIVEQKFPKLANHLEECDIDLTTITLNWFLALFFDAVPFQTMLRVWDCFLFEGPKVLFRFTIALLGLYQDEILDHTDTISVMKVLKAAVRLTYDVDGLIKYSFEELNPFPSKAFLRQRHAQYLEVLQEKLHKRLQLRKLLNVVINPSSSDKICDLPIEVIVFSDFVAGSGYVCAGNEKRGKLSLISFHDEAANLNTLDIEFDCRPVSMVMFHEEMAFVSLLSGYIVAVQLHDDHHAEILWELKLNDVALKLLRCDNRLYSSLANGTLTILENAFERMPSTLDLYHIPVSAAPITDALFDDDNLYLAVACKIVILNRHTLHTTASVYVASSATGSQVPMFEKIRALSNSKHGIWLITAHSSLLQLWRSSECQMLFDITYDHSHRRPSLDDDEQFEQVEIYSIMYHDNEVWIGTVDGYLMLYRVLEQSGIVVSSMTRRRAASASAAANLAVSPTAGTTNTVAELAAAAAARVRAATARRCESDNSLLQNASDSQRRYPPGKRLSPIQNLTQELPRHRQQMYYIPTDAETRVEENASVNEYPESERLTRKISVIIDQSSRQYSVNVKPMTRQLSEDASVVRAVSLTMPPLAERDSSSKLRTSEPSKLSCIDSTFSQTDVSAVSANINENSVDSDGYEARRARSIPPRLGRPGSAPLPDVVPKLSVASSDAGFSSGANSPPLSASMLSAKSGSQPEPTSPPTPHQSHRPSRRLVAQLSLAEASIDDSAETTEDSAPTNFSYIGTNRSPLHNSSMSSGGTFCLPSFPSTIAEEESTDVTATATPERGNSPTRMPFNGKEDLEPQASASSLCAPSTPTARLTVGSAPADVSVGQLAHDLHEDPCSEPSEPSGEASADPDADAYQSSFKLRRKDLDFDANLLAAVNQSEEGGASLSTTPGTEPSPIVREEPKIKSSMGMSLQMKLKISDKPVKCISLTKFNGEDMVVTGAGNYGDEEAILRWRREKNSGLWINDPLVDMCIRGRKRTLIGGSGANVGNGNATTSKRS